MATEVETLLPNNPLLKPEEGGEGGGFALKEQSLKRAKDESNSQAKESLNQESEEDACKKEFTEAPPPKVNPWTKKMSGVNGQALHGLYQTNECVCVFVCLRFNTTIHRQRARLICEGTLRKRSPATLIERYLCNWSLITFLNNFSWTNGFRTFKCNGTFPQNI